MTQNSGKHYTYDYGIIVKDLNQDCKMNRSRSRSERAMNAELPCFFPVL
jgi:hypothetical protein